MSPRLQIIVLTVVYLTVIIGTLLLSGRVTEKTTLYNRFIAEVDGVLISTADEERLISFYTEMLDFTPIHDTELKKAPISGFLLPGNRKLMFNVLPEGAVWNSKSTILIRVRNGFKKLHKRLIERNPKTEVDLSKAGRNNPYASVPPGHISQLIEQPWGKEFAVVDPDGNTFIYFRPKRFRRGRY